MSQEKCAKCTTAFITFDDNNYKHVKELTAIKTSAPTTGLYLHH